MFVPQVQVAVAPAATETFPPQALVVAYQYPTVGVVPAEKLTRLPLGAAPIVVRS